MHTSAYGRAIERHPPRPFGTSDARTPQTAPRDPEPSSLSAVEIRRIVLDLIG